MFKDQPLGTAHLDVLKDVNLPQFLRGYFEILSDEGVLTQAKRVVNLFAGNCNESIVANEYLANAGNTTCEIVAVDKTLPTRIQNVETLKDAIGQRFQFVTADAVRYLASLPSDSVDILTAFGAEYVFQKDERPKILRTYLDEVARVLKVGGFVVSPSLTLPGQNRGFEQATLAIAKKVASSSRLS